jgi:hypothetical protein
VLLKKTMGSCMTTVAYISTALCIQAGLQCIISAYIAQYTIYLNLALAYLYLIKFQPMQLLYGVKYVLLNACHGLKIIYALCNVSLSDFPFPAKKC